MGQEIRFRFPYYYGPKLTEADIHTQRITIIGAENRSECATPTVISPPGLKKLPKREVELLQMLSDAFPPEKRQWRLPTLTRHCNVSSAELLLNNIGIGMPVLPVGFLAIAMMRSRRSQRLAVILAPDIAKQLVTRSLSRMDKHHELPLNSFERGIVLEIAALATEDIICDSADDVEVRGILDSEAQLRLFFTNAPTDIWHGCGTLTLEDESGQCLLIGNGALNPEKNQRPWQLTASAAALPVALRVAVGQTVVPAASLEALSHGDIITIDELSWPTPLRTMMRVQKNEITVYSGYNSTTATWISPEAIRINERFVMNKPTASPHTETSFDSDDSSDFEISCRVEIDALQITVAQVAALIPGQVLRLNRPLEEAVELKAGNRRICRGQLVQVGNELAIEVTEVS